MIRKVVFTNELNASDLTVELKTSMADEGLALFNFEGLGSPNTTLNSRSGPNRPGIIVDPKSIQIDSRHMLITLVIPPNTGHEYDDVKNKIYDVFQSSSNVQVDVHHGYTDVVKTTAYVESVEFNHFAPMPNCAISLNAPMPWWENWGYLQAFLDDGDPENADGDPEITLNYPYSISCGARLIYTFNGEISMPSIYNAHQDERLTIDLSLAEAWFGSKVQSGDFLVIVSESVSGSWGEKSVTFFRGGQTYDLMGGVTPDSKWFNIHPGENIISMRANGNLQQYQIPYMDIEIDYYPLRAGI